MTTSLSLMRRHPEVVVRVLLSTGGQYSPRGLRAHSASKQAGLEEITAFSLSVRGPLRWQRTCRKIASKSNEIRRRKPEEAERSMDVPFLRLLSR